MEWENLYNLDLKGEISNGTKENKVRIAIGGRTLA